AVLELVKLIENSLPEILDLIKSLRSKVDFIANQDKWSAIYILLGKAFSNLESVILLAKEGRNLEMMDIARSGQESLDLVFLFFESEDKNLIDKWFEGKIIKNEEARELFHKFINDTKEIVNEKEFVPIKEMKKNMYNLYSQYTHSGYGALLDSID